jgi:hypothetical protein
MQKPFAVRNITARKKKLWFTLPTGRKDVFLLVTDFSTVATAVIIAAAVTPFPSST